AYVTSLQWLISNYIINIPSSVQTSESSQSQEIPDWIKNNAGWWATDQIDDAAYVTSLQWLISNKIINIP
ncbi:MAG: peptidase, partial [Thermoproteota archaeon]|nr:peptidase [Thermoproteota archaeon]